MTSPTVKYPDGSNGPMPSDSAVFHDHRQGKTFTWDSFLNSWVDERGNVCDVNQGYFPLFADEVYAIDDTPEQSPKCECGSWIYGTNVGHSDYCPLYSKEDLKW